MSWTSFRHAVPRQLTAWPSGRPTLLIAVLVMLLALPLALWLTWPAGPLAPPPPVELDAAPPAAHGLAALPVEAAAIEADSAPAAIIQRLQIKRGDTLMKLLVKAGASRAEAHHAIGALAEQYDPRKLKPGQSLSASFVPGLASSTDGSRLSALTLRPDPERDVVVQRDPEGGFSARIVERPLSRQLSVAEGTIDLSLFLAGRDAGVPTPVMIDLIRIFSFDVDFQRDIQAGDRFELLYESYSDLSGRPAKLGDVIFASLTLSGQRQELTRYLPKSGNPDYFDAKGRSVRKTLMRTADRRRAPVVRLRHAQASDPGLFAHAQGRRLRRAQRDPDLRRRRRRGRARRAQRRLRQVHPPAPQRQLQDRLRPPERLCQGR